SATRSSRSTMSTSMLRNGADGWMDPSTFLAAPKTNGCLPGSRRSPFRELGRRARTDRYPASHHQSQDTWPIAEFLHRPVGHARHLGDEVDLLGHIEGTEPSSIWPMLEQRRHRLHRSLRDD